LSYSAKEAVEKGQRRIIVKTLMSVHEKSSGLIFQWPVLGVCAGLLVIVFAVFGQTLAHGFINFDDNVYVTANPVVQHGLTWQGIKWVFSHADCDMYHPLTMLSLMLDEQFYGSRAGGYHFSNLILHSASVILLFIVLQKMTGALWRSAIVAAIFAIHPLRVESVAWIAERKDVMSGFFFLLTVISYVFYAKNPKSFVRYLTVLIMFILALLSKPTVVTLPFVLLLLDFWPLNRFPQSNASAISLKWPGIPRRLIMEKVPLLILAAAASIATVVAAKKEMAIYEAIPTLTRIETPLISYALYLTQMAWPHGLAPYYPYPKTGYPVSDVILSCVLITVVTTLSLIRAKKYPWLLTGWLWYLGMMVPMIGIFRAGMFSHADRMTYLPQIGVCLAIVWLVAELHLSRLMFGVLAAGVIGMLGFCAWEQTSYWASNETLWTHTLDCTKGNHLAELSLSKTYLAAGEIAKAAPLAKAAVTGAPENASAHFNWGSICLSKINAPEAVFNYNEALRLDPDNVQYLCVLAWVYATYPVASIRNGSEAVRLATRACRLTRGQSPSALDALAAAEAETGMFDEAIKITELNQTRALEKGDTAQEELEQRRLESYKSDKAIREEPQVFSSRHH
jgi:tetratricopeptide (TPR) repeat protein